MEKRIKAYLLYLENYCNQNDNYEDVSSIYNDLLIQISFFQHERLIHLLVTITFALLTIISIFMSIMFSELPIFILTFLLIVLLVPYIRHYYILENSVQKMYKYYDEIKKML